MPRNCWSLLGSDAQVPDVPVEPCAVLAVRLLAGGESCPPRDGGGCGILRLHLDHRLLPALTGRVLGRQDDRAGSQASPPPGRIEAVGDIHLAGSQALPCEPQVDRACERLVGAYPDAESAEWPGSVPLFPAVLEVLFNALARAGAAVQPANQQLIFPREMRLHIVQAQRRQSDDPVGQLHFMHPPILDAEAASRHRIPRDIAQSYSTTGDDLDVAGVITASEPSWIAPFTGLSPRCFGKLLTALRREGADAVRRGRPWSLPLEDRALLVAAYWRTNLTMRQLAPLFGVSKSAADRIIDHLGPMLALQPRKRFAKGTVLIVDGTLVPTRDHAVAEQSKNYRYSTNHQVVIDADTRLVVVVGRPLAGNRNDCRAWEESGAKAAVGRTLTIADGGYPGTGLVMPHRRRKGEDLPDWKRRTTSPTSRSGPASSTSSPA